MGQLFCPNDLYEKERTGIIANSDSLVLIKTDNKNK